MSPESNSPSGRGPEVIVVCSLFTILATITFALRVYVRTRMVKWFGADDWAIAVGWFFFTLHSTFSIIGAMHGTGQRVNLIQPASDVHIAMKWWWLCEVLHYVSNMAVKLSIILMLLRLVVEDLHKILLYIVTGIFQVCSIVAFFLFIFQCSPITFFWTRYEGVTGGYCMDMDRIIAWVYVYSGVTVVCDWTMALLPWFVVRKLQLDFRTKLMVTFVLAIGSIASVATIVRIPYISGLRHKDDLLFYSADVAIWSCCETGLSIVASCAATLKPLFKSVIAQSKKFSSNGTTKLSISRSDTAHSHRSRGHSKAEYFQAPDRSPGTSELGQGPFDDAYGKATDFSDLDTSYFDHSNELETGKKVEVTVTRRGSE